MIERKVGLGPRGTKTQSHFAVVSPQRLRCYSPAFFLHDGMESSRESSRNATRCRAKTFKWSQTRSPPHPTLGNADGQVGFWELCSVTGSLFLPHTCLHASVFGAQPCGMRLARLVLCVLHVLSCVLGWLVNKLCSSLCRHTWCKARTCTQGHRLTLCVFPAQELWHYCDILKTLRMFSDTWPHLLMHMF